VAKVNLFNIDLKLIPDDIIIQIAESLGCNYKKPTRRINSYSNIILQKLLNNEDHIDDELFDLEAEENKVIEKEYKNKCAIHFNHILDWLVNNNYMMELE